MAPSEHENIQSAGINQTGRGGGGGGGGMAETHNLSFVYSALPTKITKAGREEKKIFGCRTLCCKTCVVSKTKKVYEECTLLVILPSITLHLMPGLRNKSNREN